MSINQMSLFNFMTKQPTPKTDHITIEIDGAARGNPGPSGIGIVIKNGPTLLGAYGFYLGHKTNNQAEYAALIVALAIVEKKYATWFSQRPHITVQSDSQLLVKQITGEYKVKNDELKIMHAAAKKLLTSYKYSIKHVLREKNQAADEQANNGVDAKKKIPTTLLNFLADYGVPQSLIA